MNRAFAIAAISLTLVTACSRTDQSSQFSANIPILPGGEGVAGSFGEPPGPVRTLIPPIELVTADGFSDGGTTYVSLKDSNGTRAIFCVAQNAFESEYPPNALYVGGTHPSDSSSRLPVSQNETQMLIQSLRLAVKDAEYTLTSGNPTEEALRDALEVTESKHGTAQIWAIRFARQGLRMLSDRTDFPLANLAELDARIAKMTSVDLPALAKTFRESPVADRAEAWGTLQPCLSGKLKSDPQSDVKSYLVDLLGEPSEKAISECRSMMSLDPAASLQILAYLIAQDGQGSTYLAIDITNPTGLRFQQIVSFKPKK